MGGQSISTSETRIEALSLQSSVVGAVIPVVYGVCRVPGNLIWYGGFKATAHTTSQGGKGGNVKTQNTTYTYTASVAMGVAQGQITNITTIWRDKEVIVGGVLTNPPSQAVESFTPSAGIGQYCSPVTVAHAATFFSTVRVRVVFAGGMLAEGLDYTRTGGTYTINQRFAGQAIQITYLYGAGTQTGQTAMQQAGITLQSGALNQTALAWMTSSFPASAWPYPGLAYVAAQDYSLGTGAKVQNHSFEVEGIGAYSVGVTVKDVDPSICLTDLLTNGRYGAHMPYTAISDLTAWSTYCKAAGLLMSPALSTQMRAADFVTQLAQLTNTAVVWSGTQLKMVPYGDQALSANGASYTPNVTPVYDLTDDNYIVSSGSGDDPVRVTRKPPSDSYNHVRVEFSNRANYYNTEVEEAKDDADINTYGLRTMQTITAPWITTRDVARNVAQLILQRSLNVVAQYEFMLPWAYALLEPMDLVTVTDSALGLSKWAVRITDVDEDDAGIKIVAEDFPLGVATAALYTSQSNTGFLHNYLVSPGSITTPVMFEAPVTLPSTGLEVYAAVSGASVNWGGCNVWVSLDGTNYRKVQTLYGGSRYGIITTVVGSTFDVLLNAPGGDPNGATLTGGSAADSAAFSTLCYIGGTTPEYIGYQTATLNSLRAYTLGGLTRGGFSTQSNAHALFNSFVRVDDRIAKTGALDLSMVGKNISLKFTSFNIYGGAEEALSAVTAYSYTILGTMVQLPPSAPASVAATVETVGIRLTCAKNPEPDVVAYEWRVGATWAAATVLDKNGGTSYLWGMQAFGTYTVWVAARDFFNNLSTPVSTTVAIAPATITGLTSGIVAADLALTWTGVQGSFAIGSYELRYGTTYATATSIATATVTRHVRRVDWSGTQRWWVTPIDIQGNAGTPSSIDVAVAAPGAIIPGTTSKPSTEVIDNNVLLYWTAPASGSLPIDRYEVRKGASWAAGAFVGSNGNSTFTAIFEQASGTFTYWVTAYDTAGNLGTPASIVATVNQPPDYILRSNIDSTFSGTKSNTYLENGALYGPVDTTATWATHFTGNSWTTIDAQIAAGFPLYFEPTASTGFYEETFDYGAVLPATTVTATVNSTAVVGTVTLTPLISWKKLVGDAWTDLASGVTSALLSQFQFIKVRYTLTPTGTAGQNLVKINGINVKLNVKLRSDSGSATAVATTGVVVNFGYAFVQCDTPIVQPQGSTPLIPVVIFAGGANPTSFTVHLYNLAGADVGGAFSWTVRGY